MNIKTFPENLKNLRKASGLSQSQLAEIIKVSIKTISHWETGYSEPSLLYLNLLANHFEISIDQLVGRID